MCFCAKQQSLGAPIPAGYELSFSNKQASSNANNYMGVHTFDTYNTTACAALCDAVATCNAFNIYFERDPTVNPAPDCPNPPSFTNVKCTLWGSGVTAETAVNKGQFREEFQVVIAGSNGMYDTCTEQPMILDQHLVAIDPVLTFFYFFSSLSSIHRWNEYV